MIKNNDIVLFQGDSVTDCGRDKSNNSSLGSGYAMIAASLFHANNPDINVTFINKGLSGNRTKDLVDRWDTDCLQVKPTIVSILIGINDCWRRYDRNDPTPAEKFEENYRKILTQTKNVLNSRIILCEPFLLPYPNDRLKWREDLNPKIDIVRKLAQDFKTLLLPLDGIFNSISSIKPPEFWAHDGIHPSNAGHALIAIEWLKAVEKLS